MNATRSVAICLEAVKKSFKGVPVLNGVNLTVDTGSIFALLGSNGAGKTTLIKILTTLITPDIGNIKIFDFDVITDCERVREKISLTGQFAAVDDVLTGRDNLRLIGALRHLPDVDSQVETLLKQFHLEDAADRRVSTYSGGMRRRLDIAMSMMGNPAIIFLDEPTTGLDPQSRSAMWSIIKSLAKEGKTIFLTTQYLEEAEHLANQIAILNHGKIIAKGSPNELKNRLPQGIIELSLQDEQDIQPALALLEDFAVKENLEMLSLTVVTDGSIKQLVEIFNRIKQSGINITSFVQKLPTLEDAFNVLISDKNRGEHQ